ncbi:DUF5681 domain-containing protein [Kushneria marisflavi]|uniref:DUF5681 domain-containing protein n=1 Tax=Kushneria marisflavi TaxID=157779 RepID=UPI000E70F050|nr:DUF5681 domain-containing protein [Kushneria marisflavi]RKD75785.1 hypothetical protein C8D96_3359 [Kushneria marisflavi]
MTKESDKEAVRGDRGRFKKGRSGNPAGRPKGSVNTQLRKQLEPHTPALVEKVVQAALAGDMAAMKLCLDRILPPLKASAQTINVDLPNDGSLSDTARAFVDAAARGDIPGDLAAQLVQAIGQTARVIEVDDLQRRLEALERSQDA